MAGWAGTTLGCGTVDLAGITGVGDNLGAGIAGDGTTLGPMATIIGVGITGITLGSMEAFMAMDTIIGVGIMVITDAIVDMHTVIPDEDLYFIIII